MQIGSQIKQYRASSGLSQDDLAKQIYVSRQTFSNWETDRTYPDIHNLILLSVLFGVTIDELMKEDLAMMKEQNKVAQKITTLSWVMTVLWLSRLSLSPLHEILGQYRCHFLLDIAECGSHCQRCH